MPYPPGTVVAGKYRIERLLGEGGMGWVVVATHLQLEQRVALKFMHASLASNNPDAVARFLREARAAARIQSDHVGRVSDFGTLEDGAPYLVMEYLEGKDLDALLQARRVLPVPLAIDYALQACEGLAEAHIKGIVHRDLKPANLFLAQRSDGSVRVKLLDFGISKLSPTAGSSEHGMTNTQALMGSPVYMAPEQLRSSKNVDARADLWSMGIILYEMLAGRPPFDAETLPEVCTRIMMDDPVPLATQNPGMPPGLDAVIQRCLQKDPQQRIPDAASLATALARFGGPEAQAIASRIARMVRPSGPDVQSTPDPPPLASDMKRATAATVAETHASFGTVGPAVAARRSPRLTWAIAAGAVFVVGGLTAAVASRSHSSEPTAAGTPPRAAESTAGARSASSPSPSIATESPRPSSATDAGALAPSAASPAASGSPAGEASPPVAARPVPPARSPSSPPPAWAAPHPSAKPKPGPGPAGTSAFGGRD
jgi:serine/threonine-protein kinase